MSLILSIEGNIGAGKSTLLKNLTNLTLDNCKSQIPFRTIIFLQEPVDLWGDIKDTSGETILEKFYKDPEKYAFSFQMMAYISRLDILKTTVEKNPNSIIICERSIWTDKNIFAKMLADEGKINEIEELIYHKWFDSLSKNFQLDGTVYLKTTPEVCQQRVIKRNRKGEDIPLDYLKRCDLYHDKWLNGVENKIELDGNKDSGDVSKEFVISISEFIVKQYNKKYPNDFEVDLSNIHEKIHC